jgi:membrane protein
VPRSIDVLREAGVRFSRDGCAFLAQALAFNALFSMIPLALLAVAALGYVYGSKEGQALLLSVVDDVAPALHDLLAENISNAVAFRGLSGAVAVVALIWSGKNLFQALAYALNRALAVPAGRPLMHDIALALVMLPAMGVLLLVTTLLPPSVTFIAHLGGFTLNLLAQVATYGASVVLVFFVAATLYTFLPNRRLPWRFGVPGAIFTSVAYELAQIAFTVYTAHTNMFHIYGALSTVFALLIWFYLMGLIFLYGAELSAAWPERTAAPVKTKTD